MDPNVLVALTDGDANPLSVRFLSLAGHDDERTGEPAVIWYWKQIGEAERDIIVAFLAELNFLGCYFGAWDRIKQLEDAFGTEVSRRVRHTVILLHQKYQTSKPQEEWARNSAFLHEVEQLGKALQRLRYADMPNYQQVKKDRDYVNRFLDTLTTQPRRCELVMAGAFLTESRMRSALKATDYLVKIMS